MRHVRTVFITVVFAAVILAAGYGGIVMSGNQILNNSSGPSPVNLSGNISKLFYSKLEDDIQLIPWNLYPSQEDIQRQSQSGREIFPVYDPYIEDTVFYTLIAQAAQTDQQEVRQWYAGQNKTIMMSLVYGSKEFDETEIFFYDDRIRLSGKEYRIKIACSSYRILSFSCIQCWEDNVKDTADWEKKKEAFLSWMEKEPQKVKRIFGLMRDLRNYDLIKGSEDWYSYVGLYLMDSFQEEDNPDEINTILKYESEDADTAGSSAAGHSTAGEQDQEQGTLQVVELKDSIILIREGVITMGLYYDVMNERVAGFHYFAEY